MNKIIEENYSLLRKKVMNHYVLIGLFYIFIVIIIPLLIKLGIIDAQISENKIWVVAVAIFLTFLAFVLRIKEIVDEFRYGEVKVVTGIITKSKNQSVEKGDSLLGKPWIHYSIEGKVVRAKDIMALCAEYELNKVELVFTYNGKWIVHIKKLNS